MTKVWMFFVVLAVAFVAVSLAIDCPPTPITPAPADIDPNQVNYMLLCVKRVVEGRTASAILSACDPDSDPFRFRLLQAPPSMGIAITSSETAIYWPAAELGVWYVDVEVYDIPTDPNESLTDRGTIVFVVRPANKPPVFGGCR